MIALGPVSGTRWTVLRLVRSPIQRGYPAHFAECVCECGTERLIRPYDLEHSRTLSCGCRVKRRPAPRAPAPEIQRTPWPVCKCHGRTECIDDFAQRQRAQ